MALPGTEFSDAYGPHAGALLQPLQPALVGLAEQAAERLYEALAGADKTARVLARLREDQFRRLKRRQAQHIIMLLSVELTREAHMFEAQRAGHAHALVGVDALWLIERHVPHSAAREQLMHILSRRVLLDFEGQMSSYRRIDTEITEAFTRIDQHVMSTANLTDLVRGALDALVQFPGDVSGFFARVDDAGELQIEQSFGVAAEQFHQAMEAGQVPRISVDPTVEAGRSSGGKAWRSADILICDTWRLDADKAPWKAVGEALGFRSSAAVPLYDESGRSIALLSLYSA